MMAHYIVQVQAFDKNENQVKIFTTIMFPHESEEARCNSSLQAFYGMRKGVTYETSKLTILKTEGNIPSQTQNQMAKRREAPAAAMKMYTVAIDKGQENGLYRYYKFDHTPTQEEIISTLKEKDNIEVDPTKRNLIFYETGSTPSDLDVEDAEVISETLTEVKEQTVEDAEVIEEKTKEETKIEATLPAVPVIFNVNYKDGNVKEHSLARVNELDKELEDLLKQVNDRTYQEKELWDKIDRVRIDAKDQRTKLKSYVDGQLKPIKSFVDSVNNKVKELGAAASLVETKADEAIEKKNNWVAEQERIAAEAKALLAETRKEKLREFDGKYNSENEVFTFSYDAGIVISLDDIFDLSEEDFEADLALVKRSYDAELKRIEDEKEAAAKAVNDANKAKQELVSLRKMILASGQYKEVEGVFTKNGYEITEAEISDLSNEEFIQLTIQHNIPKPEVKEEEVDPMQAVATPDDIELPEGLEEVAGPAPFESPSATPDPLGSVVGGMVAKHEEHQDQVNEVKRVVIEFSKDMPYINIAFGKSVLRLTHEDFEDVALANVDAEKEVLAKGYFEPLQLVVMAIGTSKKK